tara:strand:- start:200 stop:850 length:651 start_codon:yes stop_codon:yes gene_type:complete
MKTLNHEGIEYIAKTDVEGIIKDRLSKVAARANEAENAVTEMRKQYEAQQKKIGTVDLLTQQIQELQTNLNSANSKYSRHISISQLGLTDPELIEAIEWSYEKKMSKVAKKDRVELSEWLADHMKNPAKAPITIRPHLERLSQPAQQQNNNQTEKSVDTPEPAPLDYPQTNAGARPAPEQPDILTRAAKDPEFYAANREKIQEIWRKKARTGLRGG